MTLEVDFMKATLFPFALVFVLAIAGCSGSNSGANSSTGGSGGKSTTSEASGGGGDSSSSANSSGGSSSNGGSSSAKSSSGGSGGGSSTTTATTGGTSSTGGSSSNPGTTSGGSTTGGTSTGGSGSGGVTTGGTSGRGGSATGGTAAGGSAIGGTSSRGGTSGSGGTTSTDTSTIVGPTPPMGWNSWNKFACGNDFNEKSVREIADAFVSKGMKDAGYQYVNLDDCWMDGRDSGTEKIKVNATRFPSGIAALADYVHGKGLKLGIYSTPNTKTCAGIYGGCANCVGSKDYETIDAQTYADWGIDYLKYDKCQADLSRFAVMRDALKATERAIFYSINPGDQGPFCVPTSCSIDLVKIANMWRIEMDIGANWSSVIRLVDANKNQYVGAGPGHWNDPDMLEVGNGLNDTEGRAHFSMWVIMASPLIFGYS